MKKHNSLQFGVVREDPEVEFRIFEKWQVNRPVLVGSGGCTVLSLASRFPHLEVTVIEPNKAQLTLTKAKVKAIRSQSAAQRQKSFGVDPKSSPNSFIEAGNFEGLFRSFRTFLFEFVARKTDIERLLSRGSAEQWKTLFGHPYWKVAFDLFFSNSILETMFGPQAIQHAPPESYPHHFRTVLEEGLLRKDRSTNYFLAHIFLGHYRANRNCWPYYLQHPPKTVAVRYFNGTAQDFTGYSTADFIGLSNIFDWSSDREVRDMAQHIARTVQPGALVLYRQLNNAKDFRRHFGPRFKWFEADSKGMHRADRSLFYSSLHIGQRSA